jgi:hypothetical protein
MKNRDRTQKYFAKKQLGGYINEKGNKYEGYFAVFKIAKYCTDFASDRSNITFSAQETAFVDDLIININGRRELYQLKTTKRLGVVALIVSSALSRSAIVDWIDNDFIRISY